MNDPYQILGRTPLAKPTCWTVTDTEARKRGEQTGLDTLEFCHTLGIWILIKMKPLCHDLLSFLLFSSLLI